MISIIKFEESALTYGQFDFLFAIRMHWRDMATWIWLYLISRFTALSGISDEIFNRLYVEPTELGDIFQYFFGYENAQKYKLNLSVQLALIKEIIDSEIAGNTALTDEKVKQLYQNADNRAKFAASINPFWNETEVRDLLYSFDRYTLEEITAFLKRDYKSSFNIYDILLHHADLVGSYFAQGLLSYMTYHPQGAPSQGNPNNHK